MFRLRFPITQIPELASRYSYPSEHLIECVVAPAAKKRGYLNLDEFLQICEWKTSRSKSRCARNSEDRINETTKLALSARDESLKIGILRTLEGVEWPTASVILHFCACDPYPILDYRALWSVGFKKTPAYTNKLWHEYTKYTRELANQAKCSMRILDRALWQYSKEH